jgi:hypothetical protein
MNKDHINITSFSSDLTNGPNKIECYLKLAGKACERETLYLTGPIYKLRRNEYVINILPGFNVIKLFSFLADDKADKLEKMLD